MINLIFISYSPHPTGTCSNNFDRTLGQWAPGGSPDPARDTVSCQNSCLRSSTTCYGYDFLSEALGTRCYIHLSTIFVDTLSPRAMTSHYRRRCTGGGGGGMFMYCMKLDL